MERLLRILEEINPDVDYKTERSLVDDGLFDSLEVMAIIGEVESAYGIDIDPEDVTAENFNSAEAIWALISKHL